MNLELIEKTKKVLNDRNTKIINNPSEKVSGFLQKKKEITIITAAYNVELAIERCIESVINQTYAFKKIEFIIIDDKSNDTTKEIISKYANKYKNITAVYLGENSGTAGMPRNIGLELQTAERIMFLDADDWLDENAVKIMMDKMNEKNDDFIIGQTVKVTENGESIHAEFMSYKERNHIEPSKMPYLYYHMGPPSKLMKSSIIKDNSIRFPELKFGEDKSFFFSVLNNCNYLSVINKPVYYVNRFKTNNESLTQTTSALAKRVVDLQILKSVYEENLSIEKEKVLMKRLVEYDLLKTCDSFMFVRSKEKQKFINIIREALNLLSSRPYDIIEEFDSPLYMTAARLIEKKQDEEFIQLFTWYKLDKNKKVFIRNTKPFYNVQVFESQHQFKFIEIPLFARAISSYVEKDVYYQTFEIYGDKINTIDKVIIRDRKSINNELMLNLKIEDNIGSFSVGIKELNSLDTSLFTVFLRYDGYKLLNIKRQLETVMEEKKRDFIFYTTKANNLGFAIKNK